MEGGPSSSDTSNIAPIECISPNLVLHVDICACECGCVCVVCDSVETDVYFKKRTMCLQRQTHTIVTYTTMEAYFSQ